MNTDEFFPIGERFVLLKNGLNVGTFYVKKVSIDGDELKMQLVDEGYSIAFNEKMDIRGLVNCEVVPKVDEPLVEPNVENDNEKNGDLEEGLPD